jgi:hypothetical protein
VPLTNGVYQLDVIPQPVANTATLRVTVTADPGHQLENMPNAGVKAVNGVVDTSGPWQTVQHIGVRIHQRHGWEAARHAISDFFTKPLGG